MISAAFLPQCFQMTDTQFCADAAAVRLFVNHANDSIRVPMSRRLPGMVGCTEPNVAESGCRSMPDGMME